MRTTGVLLLALSLGTGVAIHGAPAHAKGKAKRGGDDAAPAASAAEVNKLKAVRLGDPKAGTFKWGMKPEEVMAHGQGDRREEVRAAHRQGRRRIPASSSASATRWTREINAVKKSYTKFEGQKTGWDVSIVGPEFQQNTGEAVLVTKEDVWTRYFFFFEDGLYKMFLAFNKDAIEGKTFLEFGKGMEAKYGRAKRGLSRREDQGRRHATSLDHYEWTRRRRSPAAGRSVRVLRRLLPGALRRLDAGSRWPSGARSSTRARREGRAGRGRHQRKDKNEPRHQRQHHRPHHRQGGQEARRGGEARGHRRPVGPPARPPRLVRGPRTASRPNKSAPTSAPREGEPADGKKRQARLKNQRLDGARVSGGAAPLRYRGTGARGPSRVQPSARREGRGPDSWIRR